jgi:hypothetical protein
VTGRPPVGGQRWGGQAEGGGSWAARRTGVGAARRRAA